MRRLATGLALLALGGCTLVMEGTSEEVAFSSDPSGATFTVAGRTATTPVTLDLPKNDYAIVFHRPGYHEARVELQRRVSTYFYGSLAMGVIATSVDMLTGAWKEFENPKVHVQLLPLPETREEIMVSIVSQPAGAEILVDGVVRGRTPANLSLPWAATETEKKVTFRLEGYFTKEVMLSRPIPQIPLVTLEPRPAVVSVRFASTPEAAEVLVDGRSAGKTPISTDVTWLPNEPPKKVEFVLAGHHPEERRLGRGEKEIVIRLREVVEVVPVRVVTDPPGAEILMEGRRLGEAPMEVPLPWSLSRMRHELTLSYPGYRSRTVEVTRAQAGRTLDIPPLVPSLPGLTR